MNWKKKLTGMTEVSEVVNLKDAQLDLSEIPQRVMSCAYLSTVNLDVENGKFRFAGKTIIEDKPLLVTVDVNKDAGTAKCSVKSESTMLNPPLLKQLSAAIVG